jgi:hypothetical protein
MAVMSMAVFTVLVRRRMVTPNQPRLFCGNGINQSALFPFYPVKSLIAEKSAITDNSNGLGGIRTPDTVVRSHVL